VLAKVKVRIAENESRQIMKNKLPTTPKKLADIQQIPQKLVDTGNSQKD
jgi:hypothetical protein